MSDAAVETPAAPAPVADAKPTKVTKPAKATKKKASKPKAPMNHPKYNQMIRDALMGLKERNGSSRQAILKYIMANYTVGKDSKIVNSHLKLALRAGVKNSSLKQSKGTGASGSFRIGDAAKTAPKAKKAAKKPKAKASSEKKAKVSKKVKKPKAAKKPKSPKKEKSPKKAAKAKPKKKAAAKGKKSKAAKKE